MTEEIKNAPEHCSPSLIWMSVIFIPVLSIKKFIFASSNKTRFLAIQWPRKIWLDTTDEKNSIWRDCVQKSKEWTKSLVNCIGNLRCEWFLISGQGSYRRFFLTEAENAFILATKKKLSFAIFVIFELTKQNLLLNC